VREHRIEVAARRHGAQAAGACGRQQQEQRQPGGQCQRHGQAVARVQRAQGWRPGVVGIGLAAHLRHGLRHVHRKLMRRCVLAGVQAGAAVVAQVGQVVHIGLREVQPARHRRKHRAEALAVAAGVADLQLRATSASAPLKGRVKIGVACATGQRFKRLHGRPPGRRSMRPNIVPMVMPTPAV
jgi:hypothetical protein